MTHTLEPSLLTAAQAALYLGVSKTYFETEIRPHISFVDMKAPSAKKPMPRWARADLDAFIATRHRTRRAS